MFHIGDHEFFFSLWSLIKSVLNILSDWIFEDPLLPGLVDPPTEKDPVWGHPAAGE